MPVGNKLVYCEFRIAELGRQYKIKIHYGIGNAHMVPIFKKSLTGHYILFSLNILNLFIWLIDVIIS